MTVPRARTLLAAAVTLPLLGGGLTACSGETALPLSEVRDSAGITIVENRVPAALPWSVGASPRVSIGAVDGPREYQLYIVSDVTRLDDGRIVVANTGTAEILVYAADGSHLDTWGREGEGPGEYQTLRAVSEWTADSVIVHDARQGRLTVLDYEGELGRTFGIATEGTGALRFSAVRPPGAILAAASTMFAVGQAEGGLQRTEMRYSLVDAEGSVVTEFGAFPGSEEYLVSTEQFLSVRFSPFRRHEVSAVWGDLLILGSNDRFELRAFDGEGTLRRIVRVDHDVIVPTQTEFDAWMDARLASLSDEARAREMVFLEGMPLGEAKPAFGTLIVDKTERLWVSDFEVEEPAPTRWTVFDPDGRVAGTIDTPEGLEIHEIGEDYILGLVEDDFDVEYVQLWSLDRVDRTSHE